MSETMNIINDFSKDSSITSKPSNDIRNPMKGIIVVSNDIAKDAVVNAFMNRYNFAPDLSCIYFTGRDEKWTHKEDDTNFYTARYWVAIRRPDESSTSSNKSVMANFNMEIGFTTKTYSYEDESRKVNNTYFDSIYTIKSLNYCGY